MGLAKLERIVSVSSEDPAFPAENLLKNEYSDKKWKNKNSDEKQISVVIQFEKAEIITKVDIGNYGSAFIEVMVSRSSAPDDFKVLIAASSLMTLQEAKLGTNLSSVRFFKEDELVKDVSLEKWDRIKLICSQPYNKIIQYGLAFVVVHTNSRNESINSPSPTLGLFKLKKEEVISKGVGSLFAKRKATPDLSITGAAAIRTASTSGVIEKKQHIPHPSSNGSKTQSNNSGDLSDLEALRKKTLKKRRPVTEVNSNTTKGKKGQSDELGANTSSNNRNLATDTKTKPKPRLEKPFNQLLHNVIFTISGFQNPLRGEIRSKAIAMGAKYKPDWDNNCTHLICAFPNTPKFNQVLGHGKIIKKEWVELCYDRRMRLPWRRFALHPPDKKSPESEEEVFEFVVRPPSPVDNRRRISVSQSSGGDTEDEIERVLQRQSKTNSFPNNKVNKNEETKTTQNKISDDASEVSNGALILESDEEQKKNHNSEDATRVETVSSPSKIKTFLPNVGKKDKHLNQRKKAKLDDSLESKSLKNDGRKKESNASDTIINGVRRSSVNNCAKNKLLLASLAPLDPYDLDTGDEEETTDSKLWNVAILPKFFEGLTFHIAEDINEEERTKIYRYIFAHKGTLLEKDDLSPSQELHIIISCSKIDALKFKAKWPDVICVRPDWVWKAHDEDRIPPYSNFEL